MFMTTAHGSSQEHEIITGTINVLEQVIVNVAIYYPEEF